MNYEKARTKIRSGDLLAWSHSPWSSWHDIKVQLVRMFTRSEYCHVATAIRRSDDQIDAFEAVLKGVRLFPLEKMLPFYWVPLKRATWNKGVEKWCRDQIGEEYSQWQAILAGMGMLKRAGEDALWECAELKMEVMERMQVPISCHQTPTDVVRAVQSTYGAPVYLIAE